MSAGGIRVWPGIWILWVMCLIGGGAAWLAGNFGIFPAFVWGTAYGIFVADIARAAGWRH